MRRSFVQNRTLSPQYARQLTRIHVAYQDFALSKAHPPYARQRGYLETEFPGGREGRGEGCPATPDVLALL